METLFRQASDSVSHSNSLFSTRIRKELESLQDSKSSFATLATVTTDINEELNRIIRGISARTIFVPVQADLFTNETHIFKYIIKSVEMQANGEFGNYIGDISILTNAFHRLLEELYKRDIRVVVYVENVECVIGSYLVASMTDDARRMNRLHVLLYSLCTIAHSEDVALGLILTSRMTNLESRLERRIASRLQKCVVKKTRSDNTDWISGLTSLFASICQFHSFSDTEKFNSWNQFMNKVSCCVFTNLCTTCNPEKKLESRVRYLVLEHLWDEAKNLLVSSISVAMEAIGRLGELAIKELEDVENRSRTNCSNVLGAHGLVSPVEFAAVWLSIGEPVDGCYTCLHGHASKYSKICEEQEYAMICDPRTLKDYKSFVELYILKNLPPLYTGLVNDIRNHRLPNARALCSPAPTKQSSYGALKSQVTGRRVLDDPGLVLRMLSNLLRGVFYGKSPVIERVEGLSDLFELDALDAVTCMQSDRTESLEISRGNALSFNTSLQYFESRNSLLDYRLAVFSAEIFRVIA